MVFSAYRDRARRACSGFTLIELMIVVVVVAVLSLIALPAYTSYVQKSRRAEAITLLNQIAQEQERWRASCPTYAASATAPANDGSCNTATRGLNVANPGTGYYIAAISNAASSSYTATATAAGAQLGDTKCTQLSLGMNVGNIAYAASGTATANQCWNR
jgi:type IV pilus assembly protein PilE